MIFLVEARCKVVLNASQPASLPAVRPTSTRLMDTFLQDKGDHC